MLADSFAEFVGLFESIKTDLEIITSVEDNYIRRKRMAIQKATTALTELNEWLGNA